MSQIIPNQFSKYYGYFGKSWPRHMVQSPIQPLIKSRQLPWAPQWLTKRVRGISSKYCWLFSVFASTVSTGTYWEKPYFFSVGCHSIDWWIVGISHPFFWWLNWQMRCSLHFKTFFSLRFIILLRGEKCVSGHCPMVHSWAFYSFTWAAWWIISICDWF
jgi:hypothetical protein